MFQGLSTIPLLKASYRNHVLLTIFPSSDATMDPAKHLVFPLSLPLEIFFKTSSSKPLEQGKFHFLQNDDFTMISISKVDS